MRTELCVEPDLTQQQGCGETSMAEKSENSAKSKESGGGNPLAGGFILGLAAVCVGVCVVLLMHASTIRTAMLNSRAELTRYRGEAVANSLNRPLLAANMPLKVCNNSAEPVDVLAVISSFHTAQQAALTTFNSSSGGGHTWHIAPHSTETLHEEEDGQTVWDGSTVFYALEVRSGGRESLQAGAAKVDAQGCVAVMHD
jgi:hypothetical protein